MSNTFRIYIATLLVFVSSTLYSQSRDDIYYPYESEYSQVDLPMLRTDTSLFYRAISHSPKLYGELSRYSYNFVANNPRGRDRFEEPLYMGRTKIDYRSYNLLSRLLNRDDYRTLNPRVSFKNSDNHRLTLALADRSYRTAVRYRQSLLVGQRWQSELYTSLNMGRDARASAVSTNRFESAFAVGRSFSNGSRLSLMATLSLTNDMLRSQSVAEAYMLSDNYLYNPSWGFDGDKLRSARRAKHLLASVVGNYSASVGEKTELGITLVGRGGVERRGSLGWFNSTSPMPDYYRKLPSYFADPDVARAVEESWRKGDTRYTQIDWTELRRENRMSQGEARYITQDDVARLMDYSLTFEAVTTLSTNLSVEYGVGVELSRERNFLLLTDLLDAEYHTDIDFYLLDDAAYSHNTANDLRNPDRRVVEGDRFGFDYAIFRSDVLLFAGVNYSVGRFNMDADIRLGHSDIFRRGYYEKELFPGEDSYGVSDVVSTTPFYIGLRGGYTISPTHYLELDVGFESRTPKSEDLFLQPEYNNRTYHPDMQRCFCSQLRFVGSGKRVRYELSAFVDMVRNAMQSIRCYDDFSYTYCDRLTTDISTLSYGLEGALTIRPHRSMQLSLVASALRATYIDNPQVMLLSDSDNSVVSNPSDSYMKGCHLGAIPHLSAALALDYFGRSWGLSLDCAYAGFRYAHPDYMRRTLRVVEMLPSPEQQAEFMAQQRLDDAFRLDLSAWKSFRLGDRYALTLFLSLRNLLCDSDTEYDAYESHRVVRIPYGDSYTFRSQANRLSYSYPRSLYLSVGFRF